MTTTTAPGGTAALGTRRVARIGLGVMQLAEAPGRAPTSRADGVRLIRRALELGVDHLDTAVFYGEGYANDLVREAVGRRTDVVVATKIGARPSPGEKFPLTPAQRPEELRASVEAELRTLGVDRLDVVNLRRVDRAPGLIAEGDQVVPLADQLAELSALRDAGKIDQIGLSNIDGAQLREALPLGVAQVQNAYSLLDRRDEDLLRLCLEHGVAWVPFFPLGSAWSQDAPFPTPRKVADHPVVVRIAAELEATPAQVGLAWLLAHAGNVLLIAGTSKVPHLEQNLAVGTVSLSPEQTAELDAL